MVLFIRKFRYSNRFVFLLVWIREALLDNTKFNILDETN